MSSTGVAAKTAQTAVADKAAAGSVGLAGATWILDLAPYLQIGATVVAILAGAAAAWYHFERARYYRQKTIQERDEDE